MIRHFFHMLTNRNWGAPWHMIIAFMVTQLVIVHAQITHIDDLALRLYTPLAFLLAIGYEAWQMRGGYADKRDVAEDMIGNIAGYLIAVYPLFFIDAPAELQAIPLAPLLATSKAQLSVVVDPGHGGDDYGYVEGDICEKEVTLAAAKELKAQLKKLGIGCTLTRTKDELMRLDERLAKIEAGDLFISLHCGESFTCNEYGLRTYFHYRQDGPLAFWIHYNLVDKINAKTPWSRWQYTQDAILAQAHSPAILILLDYIGGRDHHLLGDPLFVKNMMRLLAEAIAEIDTAPPAKAIEPGVHTVMLDDDAVSNTDISDTTKKRKTG